MLRQLLAVVLVAFASPLLATPPSLYAPDPLLATPPSLYVPEDPLSRSTEKVDLPNGTSPAPDRKIAGQLWQQLANPSDVRIIVLLLTSANSAHLDDETLATSTASLEQAFVPRAEALGFRPIKGLSHLPIVIGTITGDRLLALAALPEVAAIQEDRPLYLTRVQGAALMRADQLRTTYGAAGAGIGVAVIDSGVDASHPELSSRVRVQHDSTGTTGDGTVDSDGHGTAVAGIIAGTSGGMAPSANIWAFKIFAANVKPIGSWLLDALDVAYANRNNFGGLHVINMSIGDLAEYNSNCDAAYPATAAYINQLVNAGIVVFVSAGNSAHGAGVAYPACLANVISVGAVYDANIGPNAVAREDGSLLCRDLTTAADQVTCYSNSGAPLDLLAPADCARTPKPGGTYHDCFNGTSAASPYAAGVAAQILSNNKSLLPARLLFALTSTGKPVTDRFTQLVRPRIDALAAYQSLLPSSGLCIRDASTACLIGNRFQVRVIWQTSTNTGFAKVMGFSGQRAESDQSAFLWFFAPENFEMGLKMVNACVPPYNAFWVFISGLTNQGYTVTIRDTRTGAVKTYSNPLGLLANTVVDLSAFSCP